MNPEKTLLRCKCESTIHKPKESTGKACTCDVIDLADLEFIESSKYSIISVE